MNAIGTPQTVAWTHDGIPSLHIDAFPAFSEASGYSFAWLVEQELFYFHRYRAGYQKPSILRSIRCATEGF